MRDICTQEMLIKASMKLLELQESKPNKY